MTLVQWPKVGEVFELAFGHAKARKFKLVEIGNQPNFESVERELKKFGKIPNDEWHAPLKRKFPVPPGRPVGIAYASWASWLIPNSRLLFTILDRNGTPDFSQGDVTNGFDADWLWLVEVEK